MADETHTLFADSASGGKFWKIERTGASTVVTYGKVGTDGRTSAKEHGSEEKAEKFVQSSKAKKIKGGYSEEGEAASGSKRKAAPKKKAAASPKKKAKSADDDDDDDDADESIYMEAPSATGGKFWEAKRYGASITVRFGKVGSDGQTRTKDHGTAAKAEKFLASTKKKKEKGGYV